ncbi:MAG TPA: threonine/serine exporter family protein [Magnetospirillum sp.]|nr:threonine/serine exporter family protein [Magnetospirillum sp.]
MSETDPVLLRHRALEQIAMVALQAARVLMESGARGQVIHQCAEMVAKGLGAERVAFRSGYASLAITVTGGANSITRMVDVGRHAVNHQLDQGIRKLAVRVAQGGMTPAETRQEIERLAQGTRRHPTWLVAVAVGLACAGFGRLLGVDWPGFAAIVVASTAGQYLRHLLLVRKVNPFVVAAVVAFLSAAMGGLGARLVGSGTVSLALMASVLLLVPGVPALNAQIDIMEGSPTLGSARAVTVIFIMVFVTVGVWLAQSLVRLAP